MPLVVSRAGWFFMAVLRTLCGQAGRPRSRGLLLTSHRRRDISRAPVRATRLMRVVLLVAVGHSARERRTRAGAEAWPWPDPTSTPSASPVGREAVNGARRSCARAWVNA